MNKNQLKFFKEKKNRAIFLLSFSFSLLLAAIIFILVKDLASNDLVMTLFFIGVISYLVFIIYIRTKLVVYNMNYNYHLMLNDDLGLLDVSSKLYTQSWLNTIENEGYKKDRENQDFILYYQFFKTIKSLGRTGYVLVAIVVSKHEEYDFYNQNLNLYIERLYTNYEFQNRVKKQIIIQFKKFNQYDETHINELQQVINFKNGDLVDINLPVGYFVDQNQVYFLRPEKKYFNKFHFYSVKLAKKFSNIRGVEDDNE